MPLSLSTFRDQASLERNSLFIGAMAACSLVLNSFPDTIIRMVVAFVAGEPSRDDVFPLWKHPRKLVPLSRRFVPEVETKPATAIGTACERLLSCEGADRSTASLLV